MSRISFVIIMLIFTSLQAQSPTAVLDLSAEGISESEARTLTDRLRTELFNTGEFTVIEREMMDEILEEQGLQQSGCTSTECIVEVGRLIGVEQIAGGSIGKVGNVFSISVRLISVETGQINKVATYDHTGELGDLLRYGMKNVALTLVGREPEAAAPVIRQAPTLFRQVSHIKKRESGVSVNPFGFILELVIPIGYYGINYEKMATPGLAYSLRLDYITYYSEWSGDNYYGDFYAEGFSFGGGIQYYFSRSGELDGFFAETSFEYLAAYWEDTEYDGWDDSVYDQTTGSSGWALVFGGGLKKPLKDKYFLNAQLLIGIGYMGSLDFIGLPSLSVGMRL